MNEPIKCKHCGCTIYYIKQHISEYVQYYMDTTGEEIDNSGLHDNLSYKTIGKYAYCADCDKRFAKIADLDV